MFKSVTNLHICNLLYRGTLLLIISCFVLTSLITSTFSNAFAVFNYNRSPMEQLMIDPEQSLATRKSPEEICSARAESGIKQRCRRLTNQHYFNSVEDCMAVNGSSQYNMEYNSCWKEMRRLGVVR